MSERRAWYTIGIGVGGVFASIAGWLLGSFWRDASAMDYLRVMGLTFIGAASVGVIAFEMPSWYAAIWYQISRAESLRLEAATFRHKREHLTYASTVSEATSGPTIDANDTAWHSFHLDAIQFCLRRLSGDPLYKSSPGQPGMDLILNYSDWRKWADGWVKAGGLESIYQGSRTRWRDTWSAAYALGKLEGGYTPPHPDEAPPVLKPYNSEKATKLDE